MSPAAARPSASRRMLMSLPPPAGHATIKVIGSEGKVCARSSGATNPIAKTRPIAVNAAKALRFIFRILTVYLCTPLGVFPAFTQKRALCELSHHVECQEAILGCTQEPEHRFIQSGLDEIAQPLAAMLRCSGDGKRFDRSVRHERGRCRDVASGDGGHYRLLIDGDA